MCAGRAEAASASASLVLVAARAPTIAGARSNCRRPIGARAPLRDVRSKSHCKTNLIGPSMALLGVARANCAPRAHMQSAHASRCAPPPRQPIDQSMLALCARNAHTHMHTPPATSCHFRRARRIEIDTICSHHFRWRFARANQAARGALTQRAACVRSRRALYDSCESCAHQVRTTHRASCAKRAATHLCAPMYVRARACRAQVHRVFILAEFL